MKNVMANILAKAALKTAEKSANSSCHLWFYQPKEPKSLEKLKKHCKK
ncbi:MAG: cyclic lactone autoinducer peptide [Clostridiales bacterium]|nr:cyclic lactone autoinducer peptide [Clostridiales bacterium]